MQKIVFFMCEVLNAWAALDVFVVALIAALLEVEPFAQFIIGNKCDLINQLLKDFLNDELNGDDKCFDVVADLDTGCWILFSAAFFELIVSFVVMKTCHTALVSHPKNVDGLVGDDDDDFNNKNNNNNDNIDDVNDSSSDDIADYIPPGTVN
eukprot:TRINITY_DN12578_c0_g1_i1.p1 TRINITY_DN12578_c0_g1~~TRINITY_DN12578_c0_g1_i1.p1  ORF type:complete len:165 (-),score=57.82 TRINITY_DN12578_c0_g1_i1:53-508(-)